MPAYVNDYAAQPLRDGGLRTFDETDTAVAFPLGGIGTGNVSLGARGNLHDWELFNRPGKGIELPYSFFALWFERPSGEHDLRVLESTIQPPHARSIGYMPYTTAGLPRFEESTFRGEYPVAEIDFADPDVPLDVSLQAFTPFIPLDPEVSGIPVAVLEYTLENPTEEPLSASVAGSLANPIGHRQELTPGAHRNAFRDGEIAGIEYGSDRFEPGQPEYGEVALTTIAEGDVSHTAAWERAEWWDSFRGFGTDFGEDGEVTANTYDEPSAASETDIGSLAVKQTIPPGESTTVTFLLTWFFPTRPHSWDQSLDASGGSPCCGNESSCDTEGLIRNHYATRFDGAWDVAESVAADFERLRDSTMEFRDAFFDSTLPGMVLEAVSSQIAVIRSPTCMWLEDGSFLGYEGYSAAGGCCNGSCTHVWNYAWTLAALFPSLEREMRRIDFEESMDPDGYMSFRTPLPFGSAELREYLDEEPAVDGQLGSIMRLYREWIRSGDDAFLERLWPQAKRALEFAFEHPEWDPDEDGVMTGRQHNTYDIEFSGLNPLSQMWYLGALLAGAELAMAVGDTDAADRYASVAASGRAATEARCWNGDYYVQDIDDVDAHRYQFGRGCLSDQLLGQWYATRLDLGNVVSPDRVDTTLKSIYEHNFRSDLSDHANYQRTYALNDEAGLLLCSWPNGGEPDYPFTYSDEVWTGIEYQVASHLIEVGHVDLGLELVRAIRNRHDGEKRNPWNEFECGDHYARAMASWAVYESLCGLSVDLTGRRSDLNEHGFAVDPAIESDEFRCFWITGDAWGSYDDGEIEVCFER